MTAPGEQLADALAKTRIIGQVGEYRCAVAPHLQRRKGQTGWYAEERRGRDELIERRRFQTEAQAEDWARRRLSFRRMKEQPL